MSLLCRSTRASAPTHPLESGHRLPTRFLPEEWSGPPRLLDRPFRARHSHPPRQVRPALAHSLGRSAAAFREMNPLGTWKYGVSWPYPCGSLACRPTHRRYGYPRGARPYFRPAGLSSGRMGLSPTGRPIRISVGIATSFPFKPALPGRFSFRPPPAVISTVREKSSVRRAFRFLAEFILRRSRRARNETEGVLDNE
jgi:hypothetical protein